MAWKCYRKLVPQNPVRMRNGTSLKFGTVDGTVGFYATEDTNIQAELESLIRASQFGLSEISEPEFHEYVEKKNQGMKPLGREEFSPTSVSRMLLQSEQLRMGSEAAAVSGPPVAHPSPAPIARSEINAAVGNVAIAANPTTVATAPTAPVFTAPVGKRRVGRRKPAAPPE